MVHKHALSLHGLNRIFILENNLTGQIPVDLSGLLVREDISGNYEKYHVQCFQFRPGT